jgi:hypothetical protein
MSSTKTPRPEHPWKRRWTHTQAIERTPGNALPLARRPPVSLHAKALQRTNWGMLAALKEPKA